MSTLLTDVGTFFTQMITWLGEMLDLYESQPILLVFVVIAIAGIVIRWLRRWIPGRS